MQNAGAGSAEGGAGGQADRGAPGGAVPEAAAADDLPQVAQAPHAPGPGGDAEPAATGPGSRLHEFSLTVPFRSPLEAEIARGSLAPDAEPHRGVVHKELTLNATGLPKTLAYSGFPSSTSSTSFPWWCGPCSASGPLFSAKPWPGTGG
ncbi:EKC/KEOPS complex subunit LAGE3 isoform X1 [Elephas maximus indicus]|uniref:EKC/KEOPS complex subunit LAGE3 isoform X1 n=1 Tax=Elephas maximus indicus TaxID=99487 RepID=UPI002116EC16|nr:EKC/KEOPS complex subunit LAGE3 isoform X1 [Elephas maximus indicus]